MDTHAASLAQQRYLPEVSPATGNILFIGVPEAPDTPDALAARRVYSARAGREAIAAHQPRVFDAIVLDWPLAEASDDASALLAELRRADYPAPVVALLPSQRPEVADAARRAGATTCLLKTPDYRLQLPYAIESAIGHQRLEREHRRLIQAPHPAERAAPAWGGDDQGGQFQTFLDQLSEGVLMLEGLNGAVVAANAAAEVLCGGPFRPRRPLAESAAFRAETLDGAALPIDQFAPLRALREGEAVTEEVVVIVRPDERRVPVAVDALPLRADDGGVGGVVCLLHDRSEPTQLASMREAVLAIASHQLKNPLTVILGYSKLLTKSSTIGEDDRSRHAVAKIRQESLRLRLLVDELLEYSRLELGRVAVRPVPLDLAELVRAVAGRQRNAEPQRPVRLDVAPSSLPYRGDYGRLGQVVGTLLMLRAKGETGVLDLTLAARSADDLAALGVRDALPMAEHYATVAITADSAGDEAAWRPFPVTPSLGDALPEQDLGVLVSAALVRLHGGMLYASDAGDYLIALPLP